MLLFNQKVFDSHFVLYYFNTSNVTIQLTGVLLNVHYSLDFNTSNVTIQLINNHKSYKCCKISIHLMLLFNNYNYGFMIFKKEFQYI